MRIEYFDVTIIFGKEIKENNKCKCESNYQKYNQKPKKEVINDLLKYNNQINIYIDDIERLKKENENYKKELEKVKNDLPLLLLPITPILITSSYLNSLYFSFPLSFILISHPLLISFIDLISIIIS